MATVPSPTDSSSTEPVAAGRRRDPLAAALLLTALAILAHAGVQVWAVRETVVAEREAARSERILRALDVENPTRAAANLKALIDLGLIAGESGPVEAYLQAGQPEGGTGPQSAGMPGMSSMPSMEEYDRNGNGRIDEGPEAEIFLLHANAPEIRLLDDDMDGTLDLPEVAKYLEYMTDLRGPLDHGRQAATDGDTGADSSAL